MYLRNCWYMAAWASELGNAAPLARRLLDEPVVLFRDEVGAARALYDRCPHRFAPLSKGRLSHGGLACGYHGLAFDGGGRCVANPHGPIVAALAVPTYPTLEAHRAIWIWMGDPERADPAQLPDLSFMTTAPDAAFSSGYLCGRGDYRLFLDNILDLTHADFLHPDTLGGGHFTRTRAKVMEHGGRLSAHWHCLAETPSPALAGRFAPDDRVDLWIEVDWYPASIMTLQSGAVRAGEPRLGAPYALNTHIMTPESAQTTHYFFAGTRTFNLDDAALTERTAAMANQIFVTEDKPMVEGQQDRMGGSDFWSLAPVLLKTDEAAVRMRRKLEGLIRAEAEAGGTSSGSSPLDYADR